MQGIVLPGNFNVLYQLTPKSVVSLNIPELNYIAIMFEFNAESIGQVNYYVPSHKTETWGKALTPFVASGIFAIVNICTQCKISWAYLFYWP